MKENINNKLSFFVYIIIWFLLLLWFWIGLPQDGAMAYSIISFYLALPISSFIISCIWRSKNTLKKWLLPAFFGLMAMLLSYLTFSLANTIAFHNLHIPDLKMALISAAPSLVGLLINTGIMAFSRNKN